MKKNYFLSFSSAALVCCMAWSCSQDNGPVYPESESEEIQLTAEEALALHCSLNGTAVSKADILNQATDIAAYLDAGEGGIATKSGSRRIASLTPVTDISSVTKSGAEEDTLAYIVSFGEDLGYAVLSADMRTDPIIAICPEGDLADNEENGAPDAKKFSEAMKHIIAVQIEKAQAAQDSLLALALDKVGLTVADQTDAGTKAIRIDEGITTEYSYGSWSNAWQKGPYIKVTWGQTSPYNNQIPEYSAGKHSPTGCVAVAAAQIMSYWKNLQGYDWAAMTKTAVPESEYAINQIAKLMREVGDGAGTKYGRSTSSANSKDVREYYSNCGFEVGEYKRYDFEKVISCLEQGRPVQTFGYDDNLLHWDFLYWFFPSGGHSWVIDGLLCQQRTITISTYGKTSNRRSGGYTQSYRTSTQYQYFLHCNWGWKGVRDGWYADGVFNAEKGAEIPDSYDNKIIEGTNYQYGVKCIYDLYYNK